MDASASKVDANIKDVLALFLKIENTEFPTPFKQKNTVIKYTKLPEFDFESKGTWSKNSYTLQPRLRRIVTLDDPGVPTTRSLRNMDLFQSRAVTTNAINKRKIVTISEDDEYDLHPKFSKDAQKSNSPTSNRSVATDLGKEGKQTSSRPISRVSYTSKYARETKPRETRPGIKMNNVFEKKEVISKPNYKSKLLSQVSSETIKSRNAKDKDLVKKNKSVTSRSSISKNLIISSESEHEMAIIKSKLYENLKSTTANASKKKYDRSIKNKLPLTSKASFMIEMQKKYKTVPVIHVPLDGNFPIQNVITAEVSNKTNNPKPTIIVYTKPDGTMDTDVVLHSDMNTGTEPIPKTSDQMTDMSNFNSESILKFVESRDIQTDFNQDSYDKLVIPNVSLKKDNSDRKSIENSNLESESMPNLKIPELSILDNRNEKSCHDTHYCKSTSYVISRATLTYMTKKKINFVLGSNGNAYTNQSSSPLDYPMNIVSVFKEDMTSKKSNNISLEEPHESKSSKELKNCINSIKSLDCSYVPNSDKLMKPSDIISAIRVNNSLLQSVYMCDQFQRELHFIDSFFESLQYLESCSLSDNCYKNKEIDRLVKNPSLLDSEIDTKHPDYENFLAKLENGTNSDDSETMASKNLFLLNVLIRDEQRRAKNLLCVLKKREEALKDFAKSQIIYLEKKKKQDNTDISALKKKQRGALLKLQHECGEMQRMRKALLTLSEKRKLALMKTKKDLELKLKNHVDVEQIILGKKKLKRTVVERPSLPLKCFDLSSSGCEDSTTSRRSSETATPRTHPFEPVSSVEKCIQTCDSICERTLVNHSTDTADETSVFVDGGYLNILFHNLSLPQIFSSGKQYEVNEEGLKKFVDSTNTCTGNWSEMFDRLMDQAKNDDTDKSPSSPSTARSLVEEFEEYYRTLADEDTIPVPETEFQNESDLVTSEAEIQISLGRMPGENEVKRSTLVMTVGNEIEDVTKTSKVMVDSSCECNLSIAQDIKEPVIIPSGPLPIPAGAADVIETSATESLSFSQKSSSTFSESSSQALYHLASSVSSLAQPTTAEAEELRRQELAIEREIKELEQQSRLLVVREIPDKPPPPYMPPIDTRPSKEFRAFKHDDTTKALITNYVSESEAQPYDPTDAFDTLVHDFCQETIKRHNVHPSAEPWDSCNLLPQKSLLDLEGLVETASLELSEALKSAPPTVVSGVSSRRSDHIDDILFAEWRRVEPEWTSLHTDEAMVKNQLFETIFQRILTETVDEYKRTVLSPEPD